MWEEPPVESRGCPAVFALLHMDSEIRVPLVSTQGVASDVVEVNS